MQEEDLTEQFLKELEEFEQDVHQQEKLEEHHNALQNVDDEGNMDEETKEFFKAALGDGTKDYIQKQKDEMEADGLYQTTISKINALQDGSMEDDLDDDQEAQFIIDAHNLITKISTK